MSEKAVAAGVEFGQIIIDSLRRTGAPTEGRVAFYCTEIGVQLGNIAGDIGKDATLAIMDVIRDQIAILPRKTIN